MVPVDLTGPQQSLVDILTGIDIVISCIVAFSLQQQIPLAEAAKKAGVKRFVPCNFGTPAPRGIMWLDDQVGSLRAIMCVPCEEKEKTQLKQSLEIRGS